ncbi:MAG TPA: glutamate--tRNA ligase family protein, partial [Humisphaera sp.]
MSNPSAEGTKTPGPAPAAKGAQQPQAAAAGQSDAQPGAEGQGLDFVRRIIEEDNRTGRWGGRVATRFPPEPNGYLHIGHAKSICLNFGVAAEYGGTCNLRYDDTNPAKEEEEYVKGIEADVRWLGFEPSKIIWASDYFDQMYEWAIELIKKGKAYVDDQTAEQIRRSRGTLTAPGTNSPFRDRPVAENLDLLERMKKGEFPDGSRVVRAKIDMSSPNLNLRDPVMYRILHETHHNTGDKWCVYPMYTFAHPIEDALENITHSICTLEFEDQRPFYDWLLERLADLGLLKHPLPKQYEFARLNLTYVITSKRKLKQL